MTPTSHSFAVVRRDGVALVFYMYFSSPRIAQAGNVTPAKFRGPSPSHTHFEPVHQQQFERYSKALTLTTLTLTLTNPNPNS